MFINERNIEYFENKRGNLIILERTVKKFMNYVYMLECSDGSIYTGWTSDIKRRFFMHQKGKGAKYTKVRLPLYLIYLEELPTKSEALKREIAIKKLRKEKKRDLLKGLDKERQEIIRKINYEWKSK